jgi:hypothetical protein
MKKNLIIVLVVIVVVTGIILSDRFLLQPDKVSTPITKTPVTMKTYHDPENNFSIQIPSNWTIRQSIATNTTGLNTPTPRTQEVTITQFTVPAEMGVTVQTYKGQPTCPFAKPLNTTLAGLPAAYDEANQQWIIPTTNATMVVSIAYPGNGGFKGPVMQSQPTVVPQSTIDADKKLLEKILSTLQLSNLKPFGC